MLHRVDTGVMSYTIRSRRESNGELLAESQLLATVTARSGEYVLSEVSFTRLSGD